MESGLLSELKHREQRTTQLKTWLTRFSVIRLKSYTQEEFVEIVVKVLNRDEGIEKYMI